MPSSAGPRHQEWQILQSVARMAGRCEDPLAVLQAALDPVIDLLGAKAGCLKVMAPDELAAPLTVYRGLGPEAAAAAPGDGRYAPLTQHRIEGSSSLTAVLVLAGRRTAKLSRTRVEFLAALLSVIEAAISSHRLKEQANKLSEDLIALQEVNKIISQHIELEDIIQKLVIEAKRLVKTQHCHLFLLDDRSRRLVGSASTQSDDLDIRSLAIDLSEDSPAVAAIREKRVIAEDHLVRADGYGRRLHEQANWRAAIFAPLIAKEEVVGILVCSDNQQERKFKPEEILRAETLAHQAAIALENARLFQVVSRSQKEWETTFDAMQDCVSVHDTTGKLIRANRALARRMKTVPQRLIGMMCSELYAPGEPRGDLCSHMPLLQAEGLSVEEAELPHMGGTFQVSVSPWYDKNNRVVGAIHVAKDVSNEKLLQQKLIQSEKLSAIGELISGIAHELNNPLTGVMGYSQLLQERKDIDERARESLLKINHLAMRCQKIVQNLLSFARKQKPERKPTNVNDILERTLDLRGYELSVNNIMLARELDRGLPSTIADGHQLQQVFLNLITNAEQAMLEAHGRGVLTIRSKTDAQNNRIVVEIQDDGPGIPEKMLTRIFDPFFTTKEVGKGTGLGLSLAYGIIQEHGGAVYARSRPGEGATFVIELPIIAPFAEVPAATPELAPQALKFERQVRGKRALIVDDEQYILDFFVEIFRMFPMEVDTACNGREATEKLMANAYDLVVTDFKMPLMSGRELFQWIRQERPHLAGRTIFITGDTVNAETRSFFEGTASRCIAKPFKIEEIKEVILQTLEGSR